MRHAKTEIAAQRHLPQPQSLRSRRITKFWERLATTIGIVGVSVRCCPIQYDNYPHLERKTTSQVPRSTTEACPKRPSVLNVRSSGRRIAHLRQTRTKQTRVFSSRIWLPLDLRHPPVQVG